MKNVFEVLIYLPLFCSIIFFFSSDIHFFYKRIIWKIKNKFEIQKHGQIQHHINKVFVVLYEPDQVQRAITIFKCGTGIIGSISFYMLPQQLGLIGVIFAVFFTMAPYLYIRTKLVAVRTAGSYDGEVLINEMVNQYKINSHNIIATIDGCIHELSDHEKISRRTLYRLSMRLKTYMNPTELHEILEDFVFSFNTNWARMLANNIYNAAAGNVDVLAGLEDLQVECKKINNSIEKTKRSNMEAVIMIKFLGPVFLVMFIFMLKESMGYSWAKLYEYEFQTPAGLLIFSIILTTMLINLIVVNLLSKQKYDF